jgi:uncharacterized protein (UPF0332 family)
MSLIEKSNQNIKASALLYENQLYNASIHSAYYSCFQLILKYNYENYYEYKEIYASLKQNKNSQNNNKQLGSHDIEINCFKKLLSKVWNINKINEIYLNISILKKKRIIADYNRKKLLNKEDSEKTINLAEKTREEILKILNL